MRRPSAQPGKRMAVRRRIRRPSAQPGKRMAAGRRIRRPIATQARTIEGGMPDSGRVHRRTLHRMSGLVEQSSSDGYSAPQSARAQLVG
jgi:hypothetical protein